MPSKGVFHFVGARFECLQQIAMATLKVLKDIDQLAGRRLEIQREHGSFDAFFWRFVGGKRVVNKTNKIPPRTDASDAVAAELKRRGFKFAGTTIMYAHMQACGLVNDHLTSCFRYREV